MSGGPTPTTVWVVRLRPDGELGWERAAASLEGDDRGRMASLHHEDDRHRLAVSRLALRELVHRLLPSSPGPIVIEHPRHRAPRMCGGALRLSLAHASDTVICAASPEPVGVDVESLPAPEPAAALVERHLSPGERAALGRLPPGETARAFLRIWVRKEAVVKAGGMGMGTDLRLIDVRGGSVALAGGRSQLKLTDVDLGRRAVAAVASRPGQRVLVEFPVG
jgi:4'-phosphopantetheinyl transferase